MLRNQLKHEQSAEKIVVGRRIRRKVYSIVYRPVQICHSIKNFEICEIRVNDKPFLLFELWKKCI